MVNVRLKQAAALFIAIAFVSSIFFFFPHVSSTSPITYYIAVPTPALRPNSTLNGNVIDLQPGYSETIISSVVSVPVSNLIASNISNMLNLTESILSQGNITYNVSNGNIQCIFSDQFVYPLCANLFNGSWNLFYVGSNGKLSPIQEPISHTNLNSITSNSTYLLAFFEVLNSSNNSNSIPPIHLG
ncbi:MAG: hypothetical protein M1322_02570 [Candidatus Parvarchaeota archaeon]|jgi:hypothetical protein|nr:hypothetical protein [Candidatus Parvarchaeota archaeon]MCL5106971.1 hypothetical protein [Candidatus Parvarchaeota archaeon]